jgi:hypothetical protein
MQHFIIASWHGRPGQNNSWNTISPVADDGETVAMMLTTCPKVDGFGPEVRVVFVVILVGADWPNAATTKATSDALKRHLGGTTTWYSI